MWMMTTIGFYSAVQDKHDDSKLVIRARCEADILALAKYLPSDEAHKAVFGAGTDYPWRLTCEKLEWAQVLVTLACGIDYTNFKSSVKSVRHHHAYMNVWQDLLALEDKPMHPSGSIFAEMTRERLAKMDFVMWKLWMKSQMKLEASEDVLYALYDDRLVAWDEDHVPPSAAEKAMESARKDPRYARSKPLTGSKKRQKIPRPS